MTSRGLVHVSTSGVTNAAEAIGDEASARADVRAACSAGVARAHAHDARTIALAVVVACARRARGTTKHGLIDIALR